MGISTGRTALVIVSADKRIIAPVRKDKGSNLRLSGPVTDRIICGTKRPIKPIIPDTDTHIAATMDAVIRSIIVTCFVFTPSELALFSPMAIRLRSLE